MREKRKTTVNTGIRNSSFFCFNCGGSQKIPFPITIPMFSAMGKQFDAEHRNCVPNWKHPKVDLTLPLHERAKWWMDKGEQGISSLTIFSILCPELLGDQMTIGHPADPDDFRRCYLLIQVIPEWRNQLWKLGILSDVWQKVVDNWDKLSWLLEEQLAGKTSNGMWEFMKKLGC